MFQSTVSTQENDPTQLLTKIRKFITENTKEIKKLIKGIEEISLKWLTVAMPLLETSKRQDQSETRERDLWRYGGLPIIV